MFEVDSDRDRKACKLTDPVQLIASERSHLHEHNGDQTLILGIASPGAHPGVISTHPAQLVRPTKPQTEP